MINSSKKLIIDDEGQGLIEYTLLIAIISLALIGSITIFGDAIGSFYTSFGEKLSNIVDNFP